MKTEITTTHCLNNYENFYTHRSAYQEGYLAFTSDEDVCIYSVPYTGYYFDQWVSGYNAAKEDN